MILNVSSKLSKPTSTPKYRGVEVSVVLAIVSGVKLKVKLQMSTIMSRITGSLYFIVIYWFVDG
jgi:hypothetical protein